MEKREIHNPAVPEGAHSARRVRSSLLWNKAVHSEVSRKIKVLGGDSWFRDSPLYDLVEFPALWRKQSWARTPEDTSGFLPLKLKLDATSKLLSCSFFVDFIYVFLNAQAFSFAHSQRDHQSKNWVLLHWKNTNNTIN